MPEPTDPKLKALYEAARRRAALKVQLDREAKRMKVLDTVTEAMRQHLASTQSG